MLFLKRILRTNFQRLYSVYTGQVVEKLNNRTLLRLAGDDTALVLQGLITNDINTLSSGSGCIYAMMLNNKGRVLYDTIIYKLALGNTYYLEVDKEVSGFIRKHLQTYRLRRKMDVVADQEYDIWVHFNPDPIKNINFKENLDDAREIPNTVSDDSSENSVLIRKVNNETVYIFRDPRLPFLGSRVITPRNIESDFRKVLFPGSQKGPLYKWYRYRLGVGEGVEELPSGNCFPLEANCDFLHGINFQKGCYIGQELTARTYHTGVIRKRLMPLVLEKQFVLLPSKDEAISTQEEKLGKLRGFEKDSALALLKIQPSIDAGEFIIKNIKSKTYIPSWWPPEVTREKLMVVK